MAIPIYPNDQLALLADKKTRMSSLGKVDFIAEVQGTKLRIRALVMRNLQADCFGGTTFHADNDVQTRIRTGEIIISEKLRVMQDNQRRNLPLYPPLKPSPKLNSISLPFQETIYPAEVLEIPLPSDLASLNEISIVPSSKNIDSSKWPPQICSIKDGKAHYKNNN